MNFRKEYQQLILPLIKNLPVLLFLIIIAVVGMRKALTYSTPKYKASGAIKINNLDYSLPAIELFGKEANASHRQNDNFLSEVEVFKSKQLIRKTLKKTDFKLEIFRLGKVNMIELYNERPFKLSLSKIKPEYFGQLFQLEYMADGSFRMSRVNAPSDKSRMLKAGKIIRSKYFNVQLDLMDEFLTEKPSSLQQGDIFQFRMYNIDQLVDKYSGPALFVKPIDDEISIIKIYFEHELPEKAQLFVNSLMDTYMGEAQHSKEQQAQQTIDYLDERIEKVGSALQQAEVDLAYFRSANQLINPLQETDAALRELTQLDLDKLNMEMQLVELNQLYIYLSDGHNLQSFTPNLDVLQDPNFQRTFQQAQTYEFQKQDLLLKYAPESEEVHNVENKIKQMRTLMHESVGRTLSNLQMRENEIDQAIAGITSKIKAYPKKEKRLAQLSRSVQMNEQVYNHLMRKRTELAIVKSSNLIPHRIVDQALLPKTQSSPNGPLLYGLALFMALFVGMVFAYTKHYFMAKVKSRLDVEERLPYPVLANVAQQKHGLPQEYVLMNQLLTNLLNSRSLKQEKRGQWITVNSLDTNEGKTFISANLAKALSMSGKKVLLIDMDVFKPELHELLSVSNREGVAAILTQKTYALDAILATHIPGLNIIPAGVFEPGQEALIYTDRTAHFLQDMRWHFDYIVIDTPPLSTSMNLAIHMHQSDINLFCLRVGQTRLKTLAKVQATIEEYGLPRIHLVLNGAKMNWSKYVRQPLRTRKLTSFIKLKSA